MDNNGCTFNPPPSPAPHPKLMMSLAKILLILDLKKLIFLSNNEKGLGFNFRSNQSNFRIELPPKRGDNLSYTLSNRYNGRDLMLLFKEEIFISH